MFSLMLRHFTRRGPGERVLVRLGLLVLLERLLALWCELARRASRTLLARLAGLSRLLEKSRVSRRGDGRHAIVILASLGHARARRCRGKWFSLLVIRKLAGLVQLWAVPAAVRLVQRL